MLFVIPSIDKYDNGDKPVSWSVIDCYKTAKKHCQLLVYCEHVQEKFRDDLISIDVPMYQQR